MTLSSYQKAKDAGYSDDEIVSYLSQKDPSFSNKMRTAEEAGYSKEEIISFLGKKPIEAKKEGLRENIKEAPKQLAKGIGTGALGTYGDILDFLGLQAQEQLPGERSQFTLEAQARPEDLPHLVETEDILPRYSRLPSSEQASSFIEELGGPGKPKTTAGRYAERIGKLGGGTLALGSPVVKAPAIAGAAGQTLEELGAPPWAQAAAEIISFAKTSGKTPLTSKSPKIQNQLGKLKEMGFSDKDITLAKNALEDRGFLKKISKITPEAKESFKTALGNSENKVNEILNKSFPGLEGGLGNIKDASSELYSAVENAAKDVVIDKPDSFVKAGTDAINKLKKTLANTPQEKSVIELLEKAIRSSGDYPTADEFINFYQGLNQLGNWVNPKQREYVFKTIKDAVKQTFRDQGPEGNKLANLFEEANNSWVKFRQAEDISNLVQKAVTDEGMNFIKLNKLLENPDNFRNMVEGLGSKEASNLKTIAKISSEIPKLEKTIEGGIVKNALGIGKVYETVKALLTGNIRHIGSVLGHEAAGRLATKFLTDPKYQNLHIKMLNAIKNGKWDQLKVLGMNLNNLIEKEDQSRKM